MRALNYNLYIPVFSFSNLWSSKYSVNFNAILGGGGGQMSCMEFVSPPQTNFDDDVTFFFFKLFATL